jgi:hypothetical protein
MMNIVEAQKREGYTDSAAFLGDLVKRNDLLNFAPWYPSSDGLYHKTLKATRLGKGAFTKVNGAVPTISSSSDIDRESIAIYEADSPVDEKILLTAKNKAKVRDSEDVANLQGITNDWISQVIYSTTNEAEGFKGLCSRRSAIDSKTTFGASGTGSDLSSLWLFEFGERGFNFRYSEGMKPGLSSDDRGRHYIETPDKTGNMWAWIRHFVIGGGMEVKNDYALQRLANIESLATELPMATFIRMKNFLPNTGKDAMAFCNRSVHAIAENQAYNKSNAQYTISDIEGFGPVTRLVGIPLMMMESILDTESAIS